MGNKETIRKADMSKYQSSSWLSKINASANSIQNTYNLSVDKKPVFPLIAHPIHPELRQLFNNIGIKRMLDTGEFIFKYGEPVHCIAMVTKGITARQVGQSPDNIMAVSIPGRIACGNLNFFTEHPCVGSYHALVPSEVCIVNSKLLKTILAKEPELLWHFVENMELITLSDRLGFAVQSMLPLEERIKSFYLAWAVNYAVYEPGPEGEEGWLTMPPTLQRKHLCNLAKSSKFSLDVALKDWKSSGELYMEDGMIKIRPSLLKSCYDWMAQLEEGSPYKRPEELLSLF